MNDYENFSCTYILQSSFFDVDPEVDHTVNDYIERILETVVMAVEDQLGTVEWRLAADPKQKNEIGCHLACVEPQKTTVRVWNKNEDDFLTNAI
ncbi:hypothetical protein M5K25_026828 [Dendrobium thyrsiflorum]|uniref:Uncharacterized protein n=1 Tax=Dendrobium thyrsiflorum TaxID=117978 RepID=A0ABD0TYT1_DENTH